MPLTQKNLGFVKAIHSGEIAPSNKEMIWFDTINKVHKVYNFDISEWVVFTEVAMIRQFPFLMVGDGIFPQKWFWKIEEGLELTYGATYLRLKLKNPIPSNSGDILFDERRIYGTHEAPISGEITTSYTGSNLGVIQKIYHLDSVEPVFPEDWVRVKECVYELNELNVIKAEYCGGSRVEYTIEQFEEDESSSSSSASSSSSESSSSSSSS